MRIKILTDDKRFYRMLELELSELGFEVQESELDEGCPIICDLDTMNAERIRALSHTHEIFGFGKLTFGEHPLGQYCSCLLPRPFLMSELRVALDKFRVGDSPMISESRSDKRVSEFGRRKNMLTCNYQKREAVYGAHTVSLSPAEADILRIMCDRRGEVVTRDELRVLLGGAQGNITDVYICRLRTKLDNALGVKFIYTVKGKGYMLK